MTEYIVYCRTDERGVITAINSSAFTDGDGWTEIDRGCGDRYAHAQGHYLPGGVMDEEGIYNYKLIAGQAVDRSEEEKEADRTESEEAPSPSLEGRVSDLEAAFEILITGEIR